MNEKDANRLLNKTEQDYNIIAQHFSNTRSQQWNEVRFLIEQYVQPGQTVLDLGCGNGRVADIASEIKAKYIGVDLSAGLIEQAQKLHPNDTFLLGSMLAIPLADNSVDHILPIASFHHIPGEEYRIKALLEMKRVLHPNGYILMTNWNLHQWKFRKLRYSWNIRKLLRKHTMDWNDTLIPWKNQKRKVLAQRYYHGFTKHEITRLAHKANLQVIDQYYEMHGMHLSCTQGQNIVSILRKND